MTTIDEELIDQADGISNCCGATMYSGVCSDCHEHAMEDGMRLCEECGQEITKLEHYEQGGMCDNCFELNLMGLGGIMYAQYCFIVGVILGAVGSTWIEIYQKKRILRAVQEERDARNKAFNDLRKERNKRK